MSRLASVSVRMRRKSSSPSGLQLDANRQTPLQLRQQIRGLRDVEGARRDEEHVVGLHRPMLGVDGGALDEGQEVALHALARHVGAAAVLARADLVDFVEEDDAVVLDLPDRLGDDGIVVHQLLALLGEQRRVRLLHEQPLGLGLLALAEDIAEVDRADGGAGHVGPSRTSACRWRPAATRPRSPCRRVRRRAASCESCRVWRARNGRRRARVSTRSSAASSARALETLALAVLDPS